MQVAAWKRGIDYESGASAIVSEYSRRKILASLGYVSGFTKDLDAEKADLFVLIESEFNREG